MDRLLASIVRFHDSLTKEIHLVNRSSVRNDSSIVHSAGIEEAFDAQVLIQSQWEPHAMELLFVGVHELQVGKAMVHWEATGVVEAKHAPVESLRVSMAFDSDLKVSSKELFYRVRADWLGTKARLKSEVPSPHALMATQLEGGWRQCSTCSDAWEEVLNETYAYCPSCGHLTELNSR
ncbi:MAG TPA: hypothetical protein VKB38_04695 [Terracidiphilus sp.]|nr:hypothetical protein [Terracidiphilus sp.]